MSDISTYISLVQQVTRLKVDKEGAAITVIEGDLMSSLPEEEVDFFLDRPFLFQILEPSTGTFCLWDKLAHQNNKSFS